MDEAKVVTIVVDFWTKNGHKCVFVAIKPHRVVLELKGAGPKRVCWVLDDRTGRDVEFAIGPKQQGDWPFQPPKGEFGKDPVDSGALANSTKRSYPYNIFLKVRRAIAGNTYLAIDPDMEIDPDARMAADDDPTPRALEQIDAAIRANELAEAKKSE